ncbi:SH3 domain-containing C40 family peptidase [Helicobacter bizzozeronii]|uniref:SH3 domain-containing C40 family peptidase n=1 Tax=Helicobacter bizzozeronii TaxID=56877 RepID=UPI000CEEC1AC|nr:SH3 domain-containing C40 family peptidase [Helicobacter bizzozeronii]GMT38802.1 Putative lipoprotein [Helicobacter bizzozeronii]
MPKILLLLVAFLAGALAHDGALLDLIKLPQKATYYLPKHALPIPSKAKLKKAYLEQWYAPWVDMKVMDDLNEVFWMRDTFSALGFGKDGKPNDPARMQAIYESMDIPHYPSTALKAVILADTSVRAVPSQEPYYRTKDGYPFDRWQNSFIFAGTPILITHYNKERTYAHIQSSFVFGWVRVEDIALIKPQMIQQVMRLKEYLTPLRDKIALYDQRKNYLATAHMGEIFLKIPHTSRQVYIYKQDQEGYAYLSPAFVNPKDFTPFPRPLTQKTMATIIDTMLGQRYGWGGAHQDRDCSAFTRDSFASFGILLPRNSLAQVQYAKNAIDLSHMPAHKKEAYIIKHATPFATILWLKGHIMLYLGTRHRKAIVAHNIWAISVPKRHKKTRIYNIGKAVITTLRLGKEHKDMFAHSKLLIDRVKAMSDLYDYSLKLVAY